MDKKKIYEYDGKFYESYWALFYDQIEKKDQLPEGYDQSALFPWEEWFIKHYLKLEVKEHTLN